MEGRHASSKLDDNNDDIVLPFWIASIISNDSCHLAPFFSSHFRGFSHRYSIRLHKHEIAEGS